MSSSIGNVEFRRAYEWMEFTEARWNQVHENGSATECLDALQDYVDALRAVGLVINEVTEG